MFISITPRYLFFYLKIFVIFSLNNFTINLKLLENKINSKYFFLLYVLTKFKHVETRKKDNSTIKATTRLKKRRKKKVLKTRSTSANE